MLLSRLGQKVDQPPLHAAILEAVLQQGPWLLDDMNPLLASWKSSSKGALRMNHTANDRATP